MLVLSVCIANQTRLETQHQNINAITTKLYLCELNIIESSFYLVMVKHFLMCETDVSWLISNMWQNKLKRRKLSFISLSQRFHFSIPEGLFLVHCEAEYHQGRSTSLRLLTSERNRKTEGKTLGPDVSFKATLLMIHFIKLSSSS